MTAAPYISNERVQFAYGKSLIMFLGVFIFSCMYNIFYYKTYKIFET
ncbi:hypothetical protein RMAECT_1260 [Rickettsia rhipicephali str. Ect]|uniref:Uncharacterized protein n=1 Tax=Rickettsia rhipicephali str. Ect TaxID=1359199 RepID=A0A0F3PG13_RICRH|nr:hypothetical protein RMAECT_1260 [Rickettsia rhipicephali str. Ect]